MKALAIIPARGASKRIPRKNVLKIASKPLIAYTIEAALKSGLFEHVIVSTEDKEIAKISKKYGADIPFIRSKILATSKSTVIEVCLDAINFYEKKNVFFDTVCILLPTNPLRDENDLVSAFKKFKKSKANALMAVTSFEISPFWALKEEKGFLKPYFGKKYMVRSQLHPRVFVDNGSIYIMNVKTFKKEKTFYPKKLIGYYMSRNKSIDIDEPEDLKLAEFFLKNR